MASEILNYLPTCTIISRWVARMTFSEEMKFFEKLSNNQIKELYTKLICFLFTSQFCVRPPSRLNSGRCEPNYKHYANIYVCVFFSFNSHYLWWWSCCILRHLLLHRIIFAFCFYFVILKFRMHVFWWRCQCGCRYCIIFIYRCWFFFSEVFSIL